CQRLRKHDSMCSWKNHTSDSMDYGERRTAASRHLESVGSNIFRAFCFHSQPSQARAIFFGGAQRQYERGLRTSVKLFQRFHFESQSMDSVGKRPPRVHYHANFCIVWQTVPLVMVI